jgi:hypothetical protein
MQADGTLSASAQQNVAQMRADVNNLSQGVAVTVSDPNQLTQFYTDFASINSTRMLGTGSQVQVTDQMDWNTSFMDRPTSTATYESNIEIDLTTQLPPNFDPSQLKTVTPKNHIGHTYLAGYLPYNFLNLDYWQIPFRYGERPHLVAKSMFTQDSDPNTLGPPTWSGNPIPNAFATLGGTVNNRQYGLLSAAWVQTNPQKTYKLSIPSGYIRILIHDNAIDWYALVAPVIIPVPWTGTTDYGFGSNTADSVPFPTGCGTLQTEGYSVGNEYLSAGSGPTLFDAIYTFPLPNIPTSCSTFTNMLQRINQMHPGYKASDLVVLLNSINLTTDAQDQEFIIYNSDFTENSTVKISTLADAPQNQQGQPDGSSQSAEYEGPVPCPPGPDDGETTEACYGDWPEDNQAWIDANRTWTPGTGAADTSNSSNLGCLGKLEVQRTTHIVQIGFFCECP